MRTDKTNYYLDIARTVAERGTCLRRNFGCVIVNNDSIISTGYTGAPHGRINCCDRGTCLRQELNIPHGERYELCFTGDMKVMLQDRTTKTFEELYNSADSNEGLGIFAYNVAGQEVVDSFISNNQIRLTGRTSCIAEVNIGDNIIKCTPDHQFLIEKKRTCEFIKAQDLTPGMLLCSYGHQYQVVSVDIKHLDNEIPMYDIVNVSKYHNFCLAVGDTDTGIFVHNCRSVHAENNAIINAAKHDMQGATLYLAGIEADGTCVKNAAPCSMCKRIIINSGVKRVVCKTDDASYGVYDVQEFIDKDDSLSGNTQYDRG